MPPGVSGDGQRIWYADAGTHKPAVVLTVTSPGCNWSARPGRRTVAMARRREQACCADKQFSELIHAHSLWRAPATAICIFERSTTWAGGRAARSHGTFGIQDRRIHSRILSLSFVYLFLTSFFRTSYCDNRWRGDRFSCKRQQPCTTFQPCNSNKRPNNTRCIPHNHPYLPRRAINFLHHRPTRPSTHTQPKDKDKDKDKDIQRILQEEV